MRYSVTSLTDSQDRQLRFYFTESECRSARKGIGEPAYGFGLSDYERQLGMTRLEAKDFYHRIGSACSKDAGANEHLIELTIREFRAIRNGLKLTLDELGELEYYVRSGQQYRVAEEALAEFERVLAEIEA